MSIQIDHTIVSSRDRRASAEKLASLLGVSWSETGVGPFCPVFVNDGFTQEGTSHIVVQVVGEGGQP